MPQVAKSTTTINYVTCRTTLSLANLERAGIKARAAIDGDKIIIIYERPDNGAWLFSPDAVEQMKVLIGDDETDMILERANADIGRHSILALLAK